MKTILKILVGTLIIVGSSNANEIKVFNFTEKELSQLDVRKVRGADNNTIYSVGSNENGNFLKAVADNAASGLGKEIKIDLNKTPFINITWKIEMDLPGIKELKAAGLLESGPAINAYRVHGDVQEEGEVESGDSVTLLPEAMTDESIGAAEPLDPEAS